MSKIMKAPLEFAAKRRMPMSPTSWAAECSAHVAWAKGLIEMMHPAVTTEDWSLMDCQEYFVESIPGLLKRLNNRAQVT